MTDPATLTSKLRTVAGDFVGYPDHDVLLAAADLIDQLTADHTDLHRRVSEESSRAGKADARIAELEAALREIANVPNSRLNEPHRPLAEALDLCIGLARRALQSSDASKGETDAPDGRVARDEERCPVCGCYQPLQLNEEWRVRRCSCDRRALSSDAPKGEADA